MINIHKCQFKEIVGGGGLVLDRFLLKWCHTCFAFWPQCNTKLCNSNKKVLGYLVDFQCGLNFEWKVPWIYSHLLSLPGAESMMGKEVMNSHTILTRYSSLSEATALSWLQCFTEERSNWDMRGREKKRENSKRQRWKRNELIHPLMLIKHKRKKYWKVKTKTHSYDSSTIFLLWKMVSERRCFTFKICWLSISGGQSKYYRSN